jgi:hypothetical protein
MGGLLSGAASRIQGQPSETLLGLRILDFPVFSQIASDQTLAPYRF